ncbi:phosphopantetheine attachment site [Serratia ureilytica]|nr:phosphopantetheine attachment site [Serratia ureilytica]
MNGFRVELGEIKSHLERLAVVNSAAVVFYQGHIYAFVTTASPRSSVADNAMLAAVLGQLTNQLPYYMVPQGLYLLNALPVTRNGKVDQAALIQEVIKHMAIPTQEVAMACTSPCEQQVAAIWCEVLQRQQVGLNDNFFEAGGGSIQIVLMHRRIEETFKVTVPIAELFRLTTVKKIADYLQTRLDDVPDASHAQRRDASQSRAQQRLQRRHQRQR